MIRDSFPLVVGYNDNDGRRSRVPGIVPRGDDDRVSASVTIGAEAIRDERHVDREAPVGGHDDRP